MVCVLGIGDCGNKQSTKIDRSIFNNQEITSKIKVELESSSNTSSTVTNINDLKIQFGGPSCCVYTSDNGETIKLCDPSDIQAMCDSLNITQMAKSTQKVSSSLSDNSAANIQQILNSQIKNQLNATVGQSDQTDLNTVATVFGKTEKSAEMVDKIYNSVKKTIDSKFTKKVMNDVIANTYNKNSVNIIACAPLAKSGCNISQATIADVQATNLLNVATDILAKNEDLTKFANKVSAEVDQTSKGVLGGIADIFKSLGTAGTVVLAIIGGLIVLTIIGLVLYMVMKSSKGGGYMMMPMQQQGMPMRQALPQGVPQTLPQGMPMPQTVPQGQGMLRRTMMSSGRRKK